MTIRSVIATIIGCTLLLAMIGGGIGYGLGVIAPGYYRGVFSKGREPGFDPVSVGLGQGLTQGTAGGVVVGLAVVALLCWREVRLRQIPGSVSPVADLSTESASPASRALRITGFLLSLVFCLCTGVAFGKLIGERNSYHRRYLEERELIAPLLVGEPALSGVSLLENSIGGVYLTGEVPAVEDLARLRNDVIRVVGERRTKEILAEVSVKRQRHAGEMPRGPQE
ncbi:hypothetical protein [Zavarzinella formosa]|uniref:hypothetical protein n=1 Tax=Zavarzinella formosa TaxID=360055 RepID=UPI00030010F9|nr:hypothetical protein [Zavarzinella formosa]